MINYYTDMDRKLIARSVSIKPFGIISNAEDRFSINIENQYDYVEEAYTMFDKVVIEEQGYEWWNTEISIRSSSRRRLSISAECDTGDYYSGTKTGYRTECTLRPNAHYSISADMRYNDITIGDNSFLTREYGGRLSLDLSTRLSSMTFIQWNNNTRKVNVNFRLRFIPQSGSNLYIVYNHLMDEENKYHLLENAAMLKFDYTYRF